MKKLTFFNLFFRSGRVFSLLILGALASFSGASFADDYPSRPIKIVVPYPPGAVGDIMIRIVTQRLSDKYKNGFVIENKSGGGGMAAAEGVAPPTPARGVPAPDPHPPARCWVRWGARERAAVAQAPLLHLPPQRPDR